jgi:TatD DNase family protein
MLIDHHCHLDFPDLAADREGVLARAREAGVGAVITISTRVRRFAEIAAIAEAHPEVFCSVGTHPHYAGEELDVTPERLAEIARHPKCVAIGEAGLDYFYQRSTREDQADGFRRHIEAARLSGLPLVIHTRDADDDTIAILEAEMARGPFKAVLHCFTGGRSLARRAVELGLYVSFSGVITFNKSEALRAIAAEVPLDRLLVETDAPYLAPAPHRGKRNEPAFVALTAAALAKVKGVPASALAAATTANAARLYAKIPRAALGHPEAAA